MSLVSDASRGSVLYPVYSVLNGCWVEKTVEFQAIHRVGSSGQADIALLATLLKPRLSICLQGLAGLFCW
jgi:hypothetical protein